MTRRLWAAVLGAVLAVSLISACSSGPAEGFRTLEKGRLKFDVIKDWQPGDFEVGNMWDVALQDEPSEDDATYRLVAASDFPDKTPRLALSQLRLFSAFGPPDESGGMSQVSDDDNSEMWRWDFTYNDGAFQVVAWAVSDKETEHVVVVAVTGAGGLDDTTVDTIENSIEVLAAPVD